MSARQKAHSDYLSAIQASPGITVHELNQRFPECRGLLTAFLHEAIALRMVRRELSDTGPTRYYPTR